MTELRERKAKLENEIKFLENSFEQRVDRIQKGVAGLKKPVNYVKKHPFQSVAAAAGIGFLTGILRRKKANASHSPTGSSERPSGITSFILSELKHLAARKAMVFLSDLIDDQISNLRKKDDSEQ